MATTERDEAHDFLWQATLLNPHERESAQPKLEALLRAAESRGRRAGLEQACAEARTRAMTWDTCRDAAPALMGLVVWLEGKLQQEQGPGSPSKDPRGNSAGAGASPAPGASPAARDAAMDQDMRIRALTALGGVAQSSLVDQLVRFAASECATRDARVAELEAEVERLKRLVLHHAEGDVVTQGSFNALVGALASAEARCEQLRTDNLGAREFIERHTQDFARAWDAGRDAAAEVAIERVRKARELWFDDALTSESRAQHLIASQYLESVVALIRALRRPEEEQPGAHTTDEALAPTASRAGGSSHANPDHRTTSPEAVGSERLTSVPPAASAPREDAGTLERAAEILDDGLPSSEVLVDELRSRSRGLRSAPLASPAGGEARQAAQEKIEFRTGSEWEDVDGADGSAPIVPSAPPPATGDVFERAAMDWYGGTLDLRARNLSKFLSARFGPAVAALEMIAKHPCGASVQPMKKPDEEPYHCGECAWCVAKDALSELRAAGAAKGASSNG